MKGLKTGGRKKGTPNKVTADVRDHYREFIVSNFPLFVQAWKNVKDPADKADIYIRASKFVVPALQSVQLQTQTTSDRPIEQQLLDLDHSDPA